MPNPRKSRGRRRRRTIVVALPSSNPTGYLDDEERAGILLPARPRFQVHETPPATEEPKGWEESASLLGPLPAGPTEEPPEKKRKKRTVFTPRRYDPRKVKVIEGRFDCTGVFPAIMHPYELTTTSDSVTTPTESTSSSSYDGSEITLGSLDTRPPPPPPCDNKLGNWARDKWHHLNRFSSDEEEDALLGDWDYWTPYFCSIRHRNFRAINTDYLPYLIILLFSHTRHVDLIYYTYRNGGWAFIVAVAALYIGIGYPVIVLETILGQYTGRKPYQIYRLLSPALCGLGLLLYIRTFMLALNTLAFIVYTCNFMFDLYFCTLSACPLLTSFTKAAQNAYHIGNVGNYDFGYKTRGGERIFMTVAMGYTLWKFLLFKMRNFSFGVRISLRIMFLMMTVYWFGHVGRVKSLDDGASMYVAYYAVMTPDWERLLHARTWLDALCFVYSSTAMCTFIHAYWGSRMNYHYRSFRDILWILLLAVSWTALTSYCLLIYIGYVMISKSEMLKILDLLHGPYGMYLSMLHKINQASLTHRVEPEVNFYIGFHFSMHGLLAFLNLTNILHVLIHCSYSETGPIAIKVFAFYFYLILFTLFLPWLLLSSEGLRNFIYLDYYIMNSIWPVCLTLLGWFVAFAYGHNLAKFTYDLRNIVHMIPTYGPFHFSPIYAYITRFWICCGLPYAVVWSITQRLFPVTYHFEFAGGPAILGFFVGAYPAYVMGCTIMYYTRLVPPGKRWHQFRPHYNYYKNYNHANYCFIDSNKKVILKLYRRMRAVGIDLSFSPFQMLASHVLSAKRRERKNNKMRARREHGKKVRQVFLKKRLERERAIRNGTHLKRTPAHVDIAVRLKARKRKRKKLALQRRWRRDQERLARAKARANAVPKTKT